MTITFFTDALTHSPWKVVSTLCSCVEGALTMDPVVLRILADDTCPRCGGRGRYARYSSGHPQLTLSNDGAFRLLALLRILDDADYLAGRAAVVEENPHTRYGSLPAMTGSARLYAMRQALLYARNTFDKRAKLFERPPILDEGCTRPALRAERLAEYLDLLDELCRYTAELGGSAIQWC